MTISLVIPGPPVAKGRPRISTRGGFARAYTPAKTVAYEGLVAMAGHEAMAGRAPIEGALRLGMVATFQVPASWSKKKTAAALEGAVRPAGRPDADNILKAIGDGLNGVVWRDDAQIVEVSLSKRYGAVPGVSLTVEAI